MDRWNYKLYADIGMDRYRLNSFLTILDTGAGPNFIRQNELPAEGESRIAQTAIPEICDVKTHTKEVRNG